MPHLLPATFGRCPGTFFLWPSCLPRTVHGKIHCSRSVQRRVNQACRVDTMVKECIQGLNALYSGDAICRAGVNSMISGCQQQVVSHIRKSILQLGPCPDGLDGGGAVRQLHAFDGYGSAQPPSPLTTQSCPPCPVLATVLCQSLICWATMEGNCECVFSYSSSGRE